MTTENRGGLENSPYEYRRLKDGRVVISWRGQPAIVLKGRNTATFLARILDLDPSGQQLVMAKATGNFKRNNEKPK